MYFKNGSIVERVLSTATSGGTLTLLNNSETYQVFTGTLGHTLKLPNATTMSNGMRFEVINSSTGVITIQDNGSNIITTIDAGASKIFRLADNSSSNGTYDITVVASGGNGVSATDAAQLGAVGAKGHSETSKILKFNPEEIGGNFWRTRIPVSVAKCWPTNWTQNGFVYSAFGVNNSSINTLTNERYDIDNNYFLSRGSGITAANARAPFVLENLGYAINGDPSIDAVERYSDVTNSWTARAAIGTAYHGLATFVLNGYGYTANGTGGGATLTNIYNPTTDAWYSRAAVSSTTLVGQGSSEYNGYGYSVSGTSTAAVRKFNPELHSWGTVASCTVGHGMGGVNASVGALVVSGGENTGGSTTTTVERFFDTIGTWQTMAPNSQARYGCGAEYAGTFMHISNGIGTGVAYTTVESFQQSNLFNISFLKNVNSNPNSLSVNVVLNAITTKVPVQVRTDGDAWKTFVSGDTSLKYGETLSTKFQPTGLIYVVGGHFGSTTDSTRFFSDETNTWTNRSIAPASNAWANFFNVDGVGYIAGSHNGTTETANTYAYSEVTDAWSSKTSLPEVRRAAAAFTLAGLGYVSGGFTTVVTNSMRRYNPSSNTWTSMVNLDSALSFPGSCAGLDRGYRFGGTSDDSSSGVVNTAARYNSISDSWSSISTINSSRGAMTANLIEKYITIAGAFVAGSYSNNVQRFNTDTDAFVSSSSLPGNRAFSAGGRMGGKGFNIGGSDGTSTFDSNYRYNPLTNAWDSRAVLPTTLERFGTNSFSPGIYRNYEVRVGIPALFAGLGSTIWTSAANMTTNHNVGGSFSIAGYGYSVNGFLAGGSQSSQVDRYDPVANAWMQAPSNSNALYSVVCFALNGRGHRVTGQTGGGPHEVLNPTTMTWSALANNASGAADYAQGVVLNGKGYILGASAINAGEVYNPSTNSWSGVTGPGAATVGGRWPQGGFIFRAGADIPSTTVEKYNDVTDTWSSAASTGTARKTPAVTFVGQGVQAGSSTFTTSTELYNDTGNYWKTTAPLILGSGYQAAFNINDSVFYAGGWNGGSILNNQKLSDSVKQAVLSAGLKIS